MKNKECKQEGEGGEKMNVNRLQDKQKTKNPESEQRANPL